MSVRWSMLVMWLRWGVVGAAVGCGSSANEAPACGDGRLNQDVELCDGSEIRGAVTCRDFGFIRGAIGCDPTCTGFLTDQCEAMAGAQMNCGNGVVDPGEECDGIVAPGLDCERLDLGLGELSCTGDCELDRGQCSSNSLTSGASTDGALSDATSAMTTMGSDAMTTVSETSTGYEPPPPVKPPQPSEGLYSECLSNADCGDPDAVICLQILNPEMEVFDGFCTRVCYSPSECLPKPMVSADAACVQFIEGKSFLCALHCMDSTECPSGMICGAVAQGVKVCY